ncbi:MAG: hypothetical protein WCP35_19110 [Verrucomicrobiota bacterium]
MPAIDLHNYAVFLNCDYESTWSGTITLTYDVYQDPNTTKDITAFTSTYGAAEIAGANISFLVPTGSSVTADYGVTFTPSDTTHYATATTPVSVTVHKASSTALVASANPSTHGNSVGHQR